MDYSKISKIGLGTVQFGVPYGISNKAGQTTEPEVSKILEFASENYIQYLDSASAYGNAEEVLGKNDLSPFRIISKFMPSESRAAVEDQFTKTLKNLRIPKLYGYLAHRPVELINKPDDWKILKKLKAQGHIQKIGFSLNSPEEYHKLTDRGFIPDLIQVPYNYLDRRFEPILKEIRNDCEIHTRSTFLQGLFFMKPEDLGNYFKEVKPVLNELRNSTNNLAGNLLKFVLEKDFIHLTIVGVENLVQLEQNLLNLENAESLPASDIAINKNILIPSLWPKS